MANQSIVLFYLFIGIFSITAIITLLGITGVLKSIKDKYLNAMFSALILEVVAAVILSYKQMDFNCDGDALIEKLIVKSGMTDMKLKDDKIEYLTNLITEYREFKPEYDTQRIVIEELNRSLAACNQELTNVDKSYYMKIIRLRLIIKNELDGTSINLVFDQENKGQVFAILEQVFKTLGKVDPNKELTPDYITSLYVSFLKYYGLQDKLISTNENGQYTGVYLTDYITSIMIRAYLEKFYPI
jgi:hypothetical protein